MTNSSAVRNMGLTSQVSSMGRQAFTLSNGNALIVTKDPNLSGAAVGYGERNNTEKIYVYESSDRINWTLRGTTTTPTASGPVMSAALFADNSVGIVITGTGTVRYIKFTYTGYTFGAWETVFTGYGAPVHFADIAITDTNMPVILVEMSDLTFTYSFTQVYARNLGSSTWVNTNDPGTTTGGGRNTNGANSVSLTTLDIAGGIRRVAMAIGFQTGTPSDGGVSIVGLKITESTGLISGTRTVLNTVAIGEADDASTALTRQVQIFRSATDEYTCGVMHSAKNRNIGVTRGTYVGTSPGTVTVPYTSINSTITAANILNGAMGISYGKDTVNFIYCATNVDGEAKRMLVNYIAKLDRTAGSASITGNYEWDDYNSAFTTFAVSSGGDRNNLTTAYHDTYFIEVSGTSYNSRHIHANMTTSLISGLAPAASSTVTSSNPALSADVANGQKYGYARYKIRWEFAKDSIFTTNLVDYTSPDSQLKKVNGTQSTSKVNFADSLSLLFRISQGVWYYRAAVVDEFGNQGPWSAYLTFTVSHPPSATNLSPTANALFTFGTGSRQFTWKFNDPSISDSQTAFQVIVENNVTGASIYDSGKITSTAASHTATLPGTAKDLQLRWKVRVWDTDDVAGAYSDYALFTMSDPATITINSPAAAAVVTSGVPSVQFTPTTTGGRTIVAYQVYITQAGQIIWTSGPINTAANPIASGTTIQVTGDKSYMVNNSSYSVYASVTDNLGLVGTSSTNVFTTAWTPPAGPAAPTLDASLYDTETAGYVSVFWDDTTRDVDFNGWLVQRRNNMINPDTGAVIQTGVWATIYTEYSTGALYEYRDYLAPSNTQAEYRVLQQVNRQGDIVESLASNSSVIVPTSNAYWLVTPKSSSIIAVGVRLAIVSDDEYTEEYEESEYTIIGRGRHVDTGQRLGWKGSVTTKIRNTANYTARQKRQELLNYKQNNVVIYLRNPFGDVYKVSVSNIGVSRIAGVGKSEFVDVTIPYGEVG